MDIQEMTRKAQAARQARGNLPPPPPPRRRPARPAPQVQPQVSLPPGVVPPQAENPDDVDVMDDGFDDAPEVRVDPETGQEYVETDEAPEQDLGAASASYLDSMEAPPLQETENDNLSQEMDRRLVLSSYYKLILGTQLFNDDSDAARQVEAEMQGFIRERLAVLMGISRGPQATPSPFEPDEVVALKAMAQELLNRPEYLKKKPRKATAPKPSIRKVEVAPEPQMRPVPALAAPPAPVQAPPRPVRRRPVAPTPEVGLQQKVTVTKVVTKTDGSVGPVTMDLTPQARPTEGPKPLPPATPEQYAMIATMQGHANLVGLDRKLDSSYLHRASGEVVRLR